MTFPSCGDFFPLSRRVGLSMPSSRWWPHILLYPVTNNLVQYVLSPFKLANLWLIELYQAVNTLVAFSKAFHTCLDIGWVGKNLTCNVFLVQLYVVKPGQSYSTWTCIYWTCSGGWGWGSWSNLCIFVCHLHNPSNNRCCHWTRLYSATSTSVVAIYQAMSFVSIMALNWASGEESIRYTNIC